MKVLFLPHNIASMQAITAKELNRMEDIEAKYVSIRANKYNSDGEEAIHLDKVSFRRSSPISTLLGYIRYRKEIRKWIKWADVLHYVWGPAFESGADLKFAKRLGKPIFVEWVGSDIRNPEILSGINVFYRRVLEEGYEYKGIESSHYKRRVQSEFAKVGALPILLPEMSLFLDKKLFPAHVTCLHRLNVKDYLPLFPSANNARPVIVHAPTVKIGKGSNVISEVVEGLKKKYDFDFTLIHNLSREKALNAMRNADIFIDQIIVGGYGMASCEAMAYGKPVVNFILPEVFDAGLPSECPIVNANPDTLKEQLIRLITDPVLRNETGKRSRLFVEKYNDVSKIAPRLVEIYRTALEKTSN